MGGKPPKEQEMTIIDNGQQEQCSAGDPQGNPTDEHED